MKQLLTDARAMLPEMIEIRRDIHMHPELGRKEKRTQALVIRALEALGLQPRVVADTGVMADIVGGQSGKNIALRADMDALPLDERTGCAFASQTPGAMHACGHDLHTTALLGAAKLICARRDMLRGTVRLLFQPDEEMDGGAQRMIDEGCMEGIDYVYGAHVAPELPAGNVAVCSGKAYAASNPFDIRVFGSGAHGAEPHLGTDALTTACAIVMELQTLVSRELDPLNPAVITIGALTSGTARNILAQGAELHGICRSYGQETRAFLSRRIGEIAEHIALAHGARAETSVQWGYAGIINNPDATYAIEQTARALLGEGCVSAYPPTLTTEDFGAFLNHASGSFWHLGVGRTGADNPPLHSPFFNPDENALAIAAAMHAAIALYAQ
ncbi:MAG: amidohydrolase [Clostridia bacterium]|nr:amidohydrolase [Clostridia bacterium]